MLPYFPCTPAVHLQATRKAGQPLHLVTSCRELGAYCIINAGKYYPTVLFIFHRAATTSVDMVNINAKESSCNSDGQPSMRCTVNVLSLVL